MKIKKEPQEIFKEYNAATQYNMQVGDNSLYDDVEQFENFYIGRQWEGVKAPDLEKPVLNVTHRVVSYLISMLAADDIGVNLTPFRATEQREAMCRILSREIERAVERSGIKPEGREALRNCAVDGDVALYCYLNDRKIGQDAQGEISVEIVENTKLLFGNPHDRKVENQPYILIVKRRMLADAIDLAVENGMDRSEAEESIQPDGEGLYGETASDSDLVTSVIKFWKENGTVHWKEVTRNAELRPEQDTGYRRYPVAWMSWETVRGSYHGHGAMAGMIPNQIFINKLWAMMMIQVKNTAFPKIFYNSNLIKRWTNRVSDAIAVPGPVDQSIAQNIKAGDFSAQALDLVERTINYTKDFMGANDVALGNIKPENTSAIIATQKASTAPLEIQRLGYHQLMEDVVRIMIEIMRVDYGTRYVTVDAKDAQALGLPLPILPDGTEAGTMETPVDFSDLNPDEMELNVDVGASSYWSELTQQQTTDALLQNGIIQDAVDYLEQVPDKLIKNKAALIEKIKARRQMGGAMNAQAQGAEVLRNLPQ